MSDDVRERVAQTIYGDGNELSWARSLQVADLVLWELGWRCGDSGGEPGGGVDVTWVPPGFIAEMLGDSGD